MSAVEAASLCAAQVGQVVSFSIEGEKGFVAVTGRLLRVEHKREGGMFTFGGELVGDRIASVVLIDLPGADPVEFWLPSTTIVEVIS